MQIHLPLLATLTGGLFYALPRPRILRHIESLGYKVSVYQLAGSLLGTVDPSVEIHAVDVKTMQVHTAKAEDEYTAACALAQSVGIDLEG